MKTKQAALAYIPKVPHISGLIFALIASLFSMWFVAELPHWTGGHNFGLSSLTLAILLGIVLGNTVYPQSGSILNLGVGYTKGQVLRLAIMLYGFKLTFTQVENVGVDAILTDILTLSSTFLLACWLGIKVFKMDKETSILVGAGSSICGAAAVIATEPVLKAQSYKVTIAVATVVVFGTTAMLIYPMFYHMGWLHQWLNDSQYGIYEGSTIHEVAQVVVAGNSVSPAAAGTAVITKMIRVMMLAPFLLILSFFLVGKGENGEKITFGQKVRQVQVPWFAFIFIGVVALHTWVPFGAETVKNMVWLDNLLLTMAMFALGLTTHISAIKNAGIKPLILGIILFAWLILGGAGINVLINH